MSIIVIYIFYRHNEGPMNTASKTYAKATAAISSVVQMRELSWAMTKPP